MSAGVLVEVASSFLVPSVQLSGEAWSHTCIGFKGSFFTGTLVVAPHLDVGASSDSDPPPEGGGPWCALRGTCAIILMAVYAAILSVVPTCTHLWWLIKRNRERL